LADRNGSPDQHIVLSYLSSMTDTNQQLAKQFRNTTEELVELIEKFDHESFNRKPANEGWSAGEVTEHLLIFDTRLNKILESATHPTDRGIAEKAPIFTARVSDRKNKIDAPPFLLPSPGIKSVAELVEQIKEERKKIIKSIEEKDLTLHSKEFPHRLFGEMTALEWINLVDVHAKRHMEQLNELLVA
jgi:uncharacterized damage-inducible protein DinB